MAKKYESEIDPDEFIRSFREEPSALSTFKRESADKKSDSESTTDFGKEQSDAIPDTPAASNDAIEDYREKFVLDKAYLRPRERFMMVEVSPDIIRKIKRIISYEGDSPCTIKSYVNNVLADHFERYKSIIEKRL